MRKIYVTEQESRFVDAIRRTPGGVTTAAAAELMGLRHERAYTVLRNCWVKKALKKKRTCDGVVFSVNKNAELIIGFEKEEKREKDDQGRFILAARHGETVLALKAARGWASASDIAEAVGGKRPSVSAHLLEASKKGYVKKKTKNGRAYFKITPGADFFVKGAKRRRAAKEEKDAYSFVIPKALPLGEQCVAWWG